MARDDDFLRLKGLKLFVGTPMYDGKCTAECAFSFAQLAALCVKFAIELRFFFACHEALVTKARNITADEFLRSSFDHLIFIDADIGFDPRDVLHVLALQARNDPGAVFDVVAAPYPLKRMAWGTIRQAAKAGVADDDATRLAHYASGIAITPVVRGAFAIAAPVEVEHAGTGFMMVRRGTFERYRQAYPERCYWPEATGMEAATPDPIHAFFDTEIDGKHANLADEISAFVARFPQSTAADIVAFIHGADAMGSYSDKYLSEDYAFCRRVRAMGLSIWMCPSIALTHTGSHRFESRLAEMARLSPE